MSSKDLKQSHGKRILMINRIYPPSKGPTGRLLFDLARTLMDEGHDVTVLTASGSAGQKRELYGVEVVRIHSSVSPRSFLMNFWICFRLFLRALLIKRPDVIITKTDPPLFLIFGSILAKLKRAKHVHWCEDLYPDLLPALNYKIWAPMQNVLQKLADRALRSCERIIVISKCMRKEFAKKQIAQYKLITIPNWYDPSLLKLSPEPEQLELPEKFRVLFAGNIGRAHPRRTMLLAAQILHETERDIEILFLGSGPGYDQLAKERARMGLDNVRFLPYQPQEKYRKIMESGDIHLISMRHATVGKLMPSRVYDAFALKRPCIFIGPEECEIAALLEEHQAGVTIPQGRPDLLAQAIKHLKDHGEDWHLLHNGAANAGQIFTPAASLKRWKELISNL